MYSTTSKLSFVTHEPIGYNYPYAQAQVYGLQTNLTLSEAIVCIECELWFVSHKPRREKGFGTSCAITIPIAACHYGIAIGHQ